MRAALTLEVEIGDERLEVRAVIVVAQRKERRAERLAAAAVAEEAGGGGPQREVVGSLAVLGAAARREPDQLGEHRDRLGIVQLGDPGQALRVLLVAAEQRLELELHRALRAAGVQQEALVDLLEALGVLGPGQLGPDGAGDRRAHGREKNASAAATTCSISRGPWASETKPASNCDGGRYTPPSSEARKKAPKRSRSLRRADS